MASVNWTVAEYLTYWLRQVVREDRRPKTYQGYEGVVRLHLIPGRKRLGKLTAQDIRIEQAVLLGLAITVGGAIAAVTLVPMVKGTTGSASPYIPAGGWLAVIGGTILLSLTGTLLPLLRLLRIPPIEAVGLPE